MCITVGYTGAYPALARQPPPISLISFTPILSIILHMIIMTAFQVLTWFLVMRQPWFVLTQYETNCIEHNFHLNK